MTSVRTIVINTVTAAAVSLAAITSGPAQAGNKDDDLLKVIAGVAAVAVFAGLINRQQQNREAITRDQPLPVQPVLPAWGDQNTGWRNEHKDTRGGPRLPAVCAFDIGNASRPTTWYAEPCLRREGVAYGLPQYCAQQINRRDYRGRAYEAGCLADAGYRTEGWR